MKLKTILIVDDEDVNYILFEEMLSAFSFNLLKANNGKEAIDICLKNPDVDLILMDVKMPVMDGYEATKKIKEFRPNLPIIAQTAHALVGDKEIALAKGCDDYISKPIDRVKLIDIIFKYV